MSKDRIVYRDKPTNVLHHKHIHTHTNNDTKTTRTKQRTKQNKNSKDQKNMIEGSKE